MLSSRRRKEFLVEFCNVSRFKKTTNNRIKSGKNLFPSRFPDLPQANLSNFQLISRAEAFKLYIF